MDGPLGIREELGRDSWSPAGWTTDSASFLPSGGGLSATWNLELANRYGEVIGAEARARNKDYLLAPAVNIQRSPLGGRNYEYFTEDPFLNASLVVPYVQGVQSQDVASCVKHFAINNQETRRGSIDVLASERTIREIYLPVFKAAIVEGGAYSLMGAYSRFRGDYLCENDYMLNQIVRGEWGFKGTVISDWGATHSSVPSAKYGLDVEMGGGGPNGRYDRMYFANPLMDSVRQGLLDESVINEMAKRVVRVMLNIKKTDPTRKTGEINTAKHRQLMYDVASESVVLLKNSSNVLPVNTSEIKSIAFIGANATQTLASGGFGAGVKVQYEITPLQGIKNRLPDVTINYAEGYKEQYQEMGRMPSFMRPPINTLDPALVEEAVAAAKASDIAIIFGGTNRLIESEATDRKSMDLPFGQVELIKAVTAANPNTIVVLIAGTAFDLREIEATSATIVWSWFNGSEAGNAIADVLTGVVNPSGKLPFTIPKKLEDSPAHATNSFPGDTVSVNYDEGILVGYRWFDTKGIEPLFRFGHGLSYTDFEYGSVATDKPSYGKDEDIVLTVSVKNTGNVSGKETVQLYVHDVESSVMRPAKELKGFSKISLNAGEEKEVQIKVNAAKLAFFDEKIMDWNVEAGEYHLMVGSSSGDIRGQVSINVD